MGQIIVRNLDDEVIGKLKTRASQDNKSLEQLVRELLTDATRPSRQEVIEKMRKLREDVARTHGTRSELNPEELIREDRDNDEPYR